MAKILVTYGWCRTAYVAVKSLHRAGHDVYSCSHLTPSMAGWSRFSKKSALVPDPFAEGEAFTNEVSRLVEKWGIDLIMPIHEDALTLRVYQDLLPAHAILACPTREQLELGVDKLKTTRLAELSAVPIPQTWSCDLETIDILCEEIGYPFVIKLKHSNSAKGVFFINNPEDIASLKTSGKLDGLPHDSFYAQRFHTGPVVGSCFLAMDGKVMGQFHEKYLRTKNEGKGTSVYRTPLHSSRLSEITQTLVTALNWTGIGHFDFIYDQEENEYILLEMNPRPWGAINLAYVNGFDFISSWIDQCLGQTIDPDALIQNSKSKNSLWLVGEGIRWVEMLKKKKLRKGLGLPIEVLRSIGKTSFDDYTWHDPLPLLAETLCYAKGFVCSGGETNPD